MSRTPQPVVQVDVFTTDAYTGAPAAVGIAEDMVTGTAHCALGPYWRDKLADKKCFVAFQASPRGGYVRVRLEGDRVLIGGSAVTVLRGELLA